MPQLRETPAAYVLDFWAPTRIRKGRPQFPPEPSTGTQLGRRVLVGAELALLEAVFTSEAKLRFDLGHRFAADEVDRVPRAHALVPVRKSPLPLRMYNHDLGS